MTTLWYGALIDLGIQDIVLYMLRILAVVVAGIAGWYIGGPVSSLIFRLLSSRRPVPQTVKVVGRLLGAILLGFLAWFLTLGFGSGGGGSGDGKGSNTGPGTKKNDVKDIKVTKIVNEIEIRLVDADKYQEGTTKYYTIGDTDKAVTLGDVVKYLQRHESPKRRKKVSIVIRKQSIPYGMDDCLTRLEAKINQMNKFRLSVEYP